MNEILGVALPTAALTALATTLTNWVSLKAIVNGTVKRVEKIEEKVDVIGEDVAYLKGRHASDLDETPSSS